MQDRPKLAIYTHFFRVPIFPAKFLEKQDAKSKEQDSGKIGEILGKWLTESCNVTYFIL